MTESTWGNRLVKKDWYWIGPTEQWTEDLFGFKSHSGTIDFIYNNCRQIVATNDKSDWAYELMTACFDLLIWDQRWPDVLQDDIKPERQCKTRLCSLINKEKFRHYKRRNRRRVKAGKPEIEYTCKFRSRNDLTRDPYISAIRCADFMGLPQFIQSVSIPWYLWRPNTWAWHRYLKNPTERNLLRYDRWEHALFNSNKQFVIDLHNMREQAVINLKID